MTVLVAADLDRTLIYSRSALALGPVPGPLVAVEHRDGAEVSYLTVAAAELLTALDGALVVPVTTRTPEQLARVRLPGASAYAVAANGGCLVVDGTIDAGWSALVRRRLADVASQAEVRAHLGKVCDPAWTIALRDAAGLFCYAVVDRARLPADFLATVTAWAADRGWTTSLQGSKLYWVPRPLTKSAAVAEVARRTGCDTVLAAGDSLLDRDLLAAADAGIHPGHGELAESGWTSPGVRSTGTLGARAGEDICRWFAARLATG